MGFSLDAALLSYKHLFVRYLCYIHPYLLLRWVTTLVIGLLGHIYSFYLVSTNNRGICEYITSLSSFMENTSLDLPPMAVYTPGTTSMP